MNTLVSPPAPPQSVDGAAGPPVFATVSRANADIQAVVRQCRSAAQTNRRGAERRQSLRAPFPQVIQLIPIDRKDLTAADSVSLGIGRHISPCGLDFYHQDPLPSRRVVVVLDDPAGQPQFIVLDVSWSRFLKQGCYLSGGRFQEVVSLSPETSSLMRSVFPGLTIDHNGS
ncbi:MAG: hypothetical protein U0795_13480 [Pirellulales bacterium]